MKEFLRQKKIIERRVRMKSGICRLCKSPNEHTDGCFMRVLDDVRWWVLCSDREGGSFNEGSGFKEAIEVAAESGDAYIPGDDEANEYFDAYAILRFSQEDFPEIKEGLRAAYDKGEQDQIHREAERVVVEINRIHALYSEKWITALGRSKMITDLRAKQRPEVLAEIDRIMSEKS